MKTAVAVEGAAVAPLFVEKRRKPPGEIPRSRSMMPRSRQIDRTNTAVAVGVPRSRRVQFLRSPDFLPRIISFISFPYLFVVR